MELRLPQCTIRSFRRGDEESLVANANDRDIWRNLRDRFPHPYNLGDAAWWIANSGETHFAVEIDGAVGGGIGFDRDEDVFRRSAEIGYWLGEAYWGQGIMSAAVAAVSKPAFDWFGLTRLFALPFARNRASSRVLERAGYVRAALLRQSLIKEGMILDAYLYERHRPPSDGATPEALAAP